MQSSGQFKQSQLATSSFHHSRNYYWLPCNPSAGYSSLQVETPEKLFSLTLQHAFGSTRAHQQQGVELELQHVLSSEKHSISQRWFKTRTD
jgi:tyrosine-protein phosphatase YwqE